MSRKRALFLLFKSLFRGERQAAADVLHYAITIGLTAVFPSAYAERYLLWPLGSVFAPLFLAALDAGSV